MPRINRNPRTAVTIVAAAALTVLALAGCSASGASGGSATPAATASHSSAPLPTGTKGAAHFDKGVIALGTGPIIVDTFIDPMCPYCGEFEKANGRTIASMVNAGTITLRIHAMTFLDKSSQGTQYSSRASAALVCVAANDPAKTLVYLGALYTNQPQEGSTGLTDAKLVELATAAGADNVSDCIKNGDYISWVQKNNDRDLNGGITGADITSIQGTPTILVDGHLFKGDFTQQADVKAFILGKGKA